MQKAKLHRRIQQGRRHHRRKHRNRGGHLKARKKRPRAAALHVASGLVIALLRRSSLPPRMPDAFDRAPLRWRLLRKAAHSRFVPRHLHLLRAGKAKRRSELIIDTSEFPNPETVDSEL